MNAPAHTLNGTNPKSAAMKRELILQQMASRKLSIEDDDDSRAAAPTPVLASRLTEFFEKSLAHDETMMSCEACGGDSPGSLTACPYCGLSDDDAIVAAAETPNTVDEVVAEVVNAEPIPTIKEATMETETTPAAGKKQKLTKVEPKKKAEPKAVAEPKAKAEPKMKVSPLPKEAKIVSAESVKALDRAEADLDVAINHVSELKSKHAGSYWDLGNFIRTEIFDRELWKQRTEGAKRKWQNFDQFARAELGFTAQVAYGLMDTAKTFTRDQVEKWGHSKLILALTAPAEARPKLLEKIEGGASHREIAAEVKATRNESGNERRDTGRKKMPAGEKTQAKPPNQKAPVLEGRKTITVANITERVRLKMFCKDNTEKRASRLKDAPYAQHELANGVMQYFSVQETPHGLVLVVLTEPAKK